MKRLLFVIFVFIASQTFAQTKEHLCATSKIKHFTKLQKASEINYPGDSRIDVTFYKLDLNLSFNNRTISGIVTINAKSLEENLTTCFF